jgi:hypothetical protein
MHLRPKLESMGRITQFSKHTPLERPTMRNRFKLLASSVALAFSLAAHANTTIVAAGPAFTLPNGSVMPGSATDYDLFGWQGPSPTVQTNYTVTPLGTIFNGGDSFAYATLAAPGTSTPYFTGIDYFTAPVATFTALSGGDFTVYILNANTDNNALLMDTSVGLSTTGVTEVDILSGAGNQYQSLQFSEFNVTGATAGQTFNVYANGNTFSSIGGISFGAFTPSGATPEPSSIVLLGTGVLSLAGAARRKLLKA